jgi:hypothetical protein
MTDDQLTALNDDLKAQLAALNDLHHPVYPGNPRRIAELEARIAEIRVAIAERKAALAARA